LKVLVVENSSRDGSTGMVRRVFLQVKLVENTTNPGFSRAANQGVARSAGRYVLLLKPDTETLPCTLESMVRFLDADPKAGAAPFVLCRASGREILLEGGPGQGRGARAFPGWGHAVLPQER